MTNKAIDQGKEREKIYSKRKQTKKRGGGKEKHEGEIKTKMKVQEYILNTLPATRDLQHRRRESDATGRDTKGRNERRQEKTNKINEIAWRRGKK